MTRFLLRRLRARLPAVLAAAVMAPAPAAADMAPSAVPVVHEVPAEVTVQAYVAPRGETLTLVVRAPLEAMRDMEFPLRGPGYLELEAARPLLRDAAELWIAGYVALYEDGEALPEPDVLSARVSLPSDRSFRSYAEAVAHVAGPRLPPDTEIVPEQALLDVLLEVPIASESSRFSIDPRWAHLGVETVSVLHFVTPGGAERPFRYTGNPGLVRLDPRWHQAVWRFAKLGFWHILDGLDHLLFILCLVIPFRRFKPLLAIVTGFTVAHSLTLAASALGVAPGALWFPPLVETLIAASIVYMALENIVGAKLHRRWLVAFGFGLVHGFGFSFVLRESLQFAGAHLLTALLSFNLGVEMGQIFVLILAIPLLQWVLGRVVAERMGVILLSALILHSAWHWMSDRGADLLRYDFARPVVDAAFLAAAMRWAMLALICVGVVWALGGLYRRLGWEEGAGTARREPEG